MTRKIKHTCVFLADELEKDKTLSSRLDNEMRKVGRIDVKSKLTAQAFHSSSAPDVMRSRRFSETQLIAIITIMEHNGHNEHNGA